MEKNSKKMEYKIVVVGSSLVGKTSLINRFVRGTYSPVNCVPNSISRITVAVGGENCLLPIGNN